MKFLGTIQVRPIYGLYWTIICIFLGILLAPLVASPPPEDHSTHLTHDHIEAHGTFEVDPENVPEVSIRVAKDAIAGWNVFVAIENFAFSAESVNQPNTPNKGHAHLYVDGEKVTRLYGTAYHLADLSPGRHEISVGLNTNDHSDLVFGGEPIAAAVTIEQYSATSQ